MTSPQPKFTGAAANLAPWILLFLVTVSWPAPIQSVRVLTNDGCIKPGTFNRRTDYFSKAFRGQPFTRNVQSTYEFSVRYNKYYKVVKDLGVGKTYILYMCGAPKPNVGQDALYLQIPLKAYAVNDDITANFLQLLGVQRGIRAAPVNSMVHPCMQKLIQGLPASSPSLPVFSSYFSALDFQGLNISFSASYEKNPLRRAEWIKYLSLFFNKEDRAAAVYKVIFNTYACNKRKALAVKSTKPVVGWLSYYADKWTLSAASYKTQYTVEAGGRNPGVLSSRNDKFFNLKLPADVVSFRQLLGTLDVVIDETYLPSGPAGYSVAQFKNNARLTDAQASQLKFLRSKNLWSIYGQVAVGPFGFNTGWFESAISQPQVVLQDLAFVFRPAAFRTRIFTNFIYNVTNGPRNPVTAADCGAPDIYAAFPPNRAGC